MTTVITVLILLACLVLAFFVLVQAPKGGGLTGNFGSLSTQVMGVKQSTDVMEKGTWATMGIIAALCIISLTFVNRPVMQQAERPATNTQAPAGGAPAAPGAPAGGAPAAPAAPASGTP